MWQSLFISEFLTIYFRSILIPTKAVYFHDWIGSILTLLFEPIPLRAAKQNSARINENFVNMLHSVLSTSHNDQCGAESLVFIILHCYFNISLFKKTFFMIPPNLQHLTISFRCILNPPFL